MVIAILGDPVALVGPGGQLHAVIQRNGIMQHRAMPAQVFKSTVGFSHSHINK